MLIPFEKYCDEITQRIFNFLHVESDPVFSKKAVKFFRWFGTKFAPFVLNVASFFILLSIFGRIEKGYGIERLFVLFMTIFVMSLRLGNKNENI